jgi:hypothetical protein
MRINWKIARLIAVPALVLLGGGCSGINASESVSPASFFLPGLLKADPPPKLSDPNLAPPGDEPVKQIARS